MDATWVVFFGLVEERRSGGFIGSGPVWSNSVDLMSEEDDKETLVRAAHPTVDAGVEVEAGVDTYLLLEVMVSFGMKVGSNSSYSRPASVSQWRAHSRAVIFHTLHIIQRDTILCSVISYRFLCVLATVAPPQESSFTSPLSLFSPISLIRRLCRFPRPLQIKSRLLPPPHPHSHPRCPFRPLTQF